MFDEFFYNDDDFEPSVEYHYINTETLLYLARHYEWCQGNIDEPIINHYNEEQGDVCYV